MKTRLNKDGILLIDKPAGISSAAVVSRLKKITGAGKVGHAGTLDPFATGLLVCGINSGTRISRFFLQGNKTYEATLRLGIETDTCDSTGEVTESCEPDIKIQSRFKSVFQKFIGKQMQKPPVYSALKHKGVPLYKLAREGRPVQKPERPIEIFDLNITGVRFPDVGFTVSCSGGTYIRTLCFDIGRELGCGGHLSQLRRTESCGFNVSESLTLESASLLLENDHLERLLIPMSDALKEFPAFKVDDSLQKKISYGQRPGRSDNVPVLSEEYDYFMKLIDQDGDLLAILEYKSDRKKYDYCCVFHKK